MVQRLGLGGFIAGVQLTRHSIPNQGTKIPQGVLRGQKIIIIIIIILTSRKKTSLVNLGHYLLFSLPLYIK